MEALRATCEELVELSDQQECLIAALLTLANSQRGLRQTESLDLADITRKVVLSRQAEAEAVDYLFQPIRQLGVQRIHPGEGHGLGLAIVRAITGAYAAALIASPRPQGGLDMRLIFP